MICGIGLHVGGTLPTMPRRLATLLAAVAGVVALAALPPMQVAACSCAVLTPAQATEAADLVFTGAAVGERIQGAARSHETLFAVEEVRKGPTVASVVIDTGQEGNTCAATLTLGARYVMYAARSSTGGWSTSMCSGSELLGLGADVPSNAAEWPDQAEQAAQGDANPALPLQSFVMILVVAALAIGSAVAFVWRGRGGRGRSPAG
jgi:hypothetical protein